MVTITWLPLSLPLTHSMQKLTSKETSQMICSAFAQSFGLWVNEIFTQK